MVKYSKRCLLRRFYWFMVLVQIDTLDFDMLGVIVQLELFLDSCMHKIFKQVTVDENSSNSACGIKEDDSIYCWGFGTCLPLVGLFGRNRRSR